eukprot:m51a1_g8352 putative drug:proton antiporter (691) ;mRNA; f:51023-53206
MSVRVVFASHGATAVVPRGATLLEAARAAGVPLEAPCGGRGLCGRCLVRLAGSRIPAPACALLALDDTLVLDTPACDCKNRCGPAESVKPGEEGGRARGLRSGDADDASGATAATGSPGADPSVPRPGLCVPAVPRGSPCCAASGPCVRVVEVALAGPPSLGDQRGDWERIADAAARSSPPLPLRPAAPCVAAEASAAARSLGWAGALRAAVWADPGSGGDCGGGGSSGGGALVLRVGAAESWRGVYGAAVDLGTTTVALALCDLGGAGGSVVCTRACANPQSAWGADVATRAGLCAEDAGAAAAMRGALVGAVRGLLAEACAAASASPGDVLEVVFVGNTFEQHSLLGLPVAQLFASPFVPCSAAATSCALADLGEFGADPLARAHVLPVVSGHVGADAVAAMLVAGPQLRPPGPEGGAGGAWLLLDVGTNCEMALGGPEGVWVASCPTGPAFEGAQIRDGCRARPGAIERVRVDPATLDVRYKLVGCDAWSGGAGAEGGSVPAATGICGSGVIEAVAELLAAGVLLPSGRLSPQLLAHPSGRLRRCGAGSRAEFVLARDGECGAPGQRVALTSDDVRAVQLAKAALCAGVRVLMARAGVERVDRVAIAGAFGCSIDPARAVAIGMLPRCAAGCVVAVGNAAGEGAVQALRDAGARAEARRLARWARHVEVAAEPSFQDLMVDAMRFPE